MIDPVIKRSLGQMIKGVEVVGAHHDGVTRAYCSHWVTQVSFEVSISCGRQRNARREVRAGTDGISVCFEQ